jgi:hypothetical protein
MTKIKQELKDRLVNVYQKRADAHEALLESDIEIDILLKELFKTNDNKRKPKVTKTNKGTGSKRQKGNIGVGKKHSN